MSTPLGWQACSCFRSPRLSSTPGLRPALPASSVTAWRVCFCFVSCSLCVFFFFLFLVWLLLIIPPFFPHVFPRLPHVAHPTWACSFTPNGVVEFKCFYFRNVFFLGIGRSLF